MITEFQGPYQFLSNFFICPITFEGITYHNSEAAFQAQKTSNLEERLEFSKLSPSQAKLKGRNCDLRSDWEQKKDDIMYRIVLAKFVQNVELRQKLIDTQDELLIEGNWWHDNYWGECKCSRCVKIYHDSVRNNNLGKILMRVRKEIRIGEN